MFCLWIFCICIVSSLPVRDRQYQKDAKDFIIGFGEGGLDTVQSVIKVVSKPKAAFKGAKYAIKHPKKVVEYLADQTRESFHNNGARAAGKSAFYAVSLLTPAIEVLDAGSALSDLDELLEVGEELDNVAHASEIDEEAVKARAKDHQQRGKQ